MVHREAGLVQHVSDLEGKMQKFIAGGKNVTEEEICRQDIYKIKEVNLEKILSVQVKGPTFGKGGRTTPLKG